MSEKAEKSQSALWENIKVIIQALLLALVIRTVLFQPFTIPSGSMMPTLLVGDYIFVNKFAYGYSRYSLPLSPNLFSGRILASEPTRGDVIVFRLPTDPNVDYIKRLIGLPGDRIQMINGVLHLNGKPVPKQPDGKFTSDYRLDPGTDVPVFRETLDNGKAYETLDQIQDGRGDNTREFVVPAGHYFFMVTIATILSIAASMWATFLRKISSVAPASSSSHWATIRPSARSGSGLPTCAGIVYSRSFNNEVDDPVRRTAREAGNGARAYVCG